MRDGRLIGHPIYQMFCHETQEHVSCSLKTVAAAQVTAGLRLDRSGGEMTLASLVHDVYDRIHGLTLAASHPSPLTNAPLS